MLNTQKLLYILPDVTYVAELLPTKKPHTFSIHSFRQINGEFMTDEENLLVENISKLFSKLEPGEYHLILPDFLFTNTIINVSAASDAKIASYLKETLLPSLELNTNSHQVQSTKLTEFKGNAKVQLSAIEKLLLSPLKVAAADHDITLTAVSPLSWTIKSVVSLEPSVSVLQIGSKLYTAFHYIGVDQATISEVTDVEAVVETIKTLKGSEPSIQTIYLLSNSLIEEELKDKLSGTIPIQQLATFKEEDSQMPSYVRYIIECGMKTLSISDFPVPQFKVGKPTEEDRHAFATLQDNQEMPNSSEDEDRDDLSDLESEDEGENDGTIEGEEGETLVLPKPIQISLDDKDEDVLQEKDEDATDEDLVENLDDEPKSSDSKEDEEPDDHDDMLKNMFADDDLVSELPKAVTFTEKTKTTVMSVTDLTDDEEDTTEEEIQEKPVVTSTLERKTDISAPKSSIKSTTENLDSDDDISLEQFAEGGETKISPTAEPIKNKTGAGSMLKMIFITVCVFFLTVAIGVGVGYFVLNWSNNQEPQTPTVEPTPVVEVIPTEAPAEEASPSASVKPEELSILIVNATTKAGHAGSTKSALDKAKVGTTKAANAKGDYVPGAYVLMSTEDQGLIDFLTETTSLDLKFSDEQKVEDSTEVYDAVIVLAE